MYSDIACMGGNRLFEKTEVKMEVRYCIIYDNMDMNETRDSHLHLPKQGFIKITEEPESAMALIAQSRSYSPSNHSHKYHSSLRQINKLLHATYKYTKILPCPSTIHCKTSARAKLNPLVSRIREGFWVELYYAVAVRE